MTKPEPNFAEFLRQRAEQHAAAQKDIVVDYLKIIVKPGDKTLQLGECLLAATFVARGAFHEVIGSDAAVFELRRHCADNDIAGGRITCGQNSGNRAGPTSLDAVILGPDLEFSLLARHWESVADRLKVGGVLILTGADISSSARLTDALSHDAGWVLQELIKGDVSVFRKTAHSNNEIATKRLVSRAAHSPISRAQPGLVAGVLRVLFRSVRSFGANSAR